MGRINNNPKGYSANLIPGHGRPKGSKNKYTLIRDKILSVFEKIGGVKAMCVWARNPLNRKDFYKIAVDLLPKNIDIGIGDDEKITKITVDFINGKSNKNKVSRTI